LSYITNDKGMESIQGYHDLGNLGGAARKAQLIDLLGYMINDKGKECMQGYYDMATASLESGRHQAGKAGTPIIKGDGVSNKSVLDWQLAGRSHAAPWADTLDKACEQRGKGRKKSMLTAIAAATAARMARALNATIDERSHECKIPECRMPTLLKPPHGKSPISIRHTCVVKDTRVEGLSNIQHVPPFWNRLLITRMPVSKM